MNSRDHLHSIRVSCLRMAGATQSALCGMLTTTTDYVDNPTARAALIKADTAVRTLLDYLDRNYEFGNQTSAQRSTHA